MDEGRGFTIIDYEDRYKQALEDISLPWLLEYDLLEPVDLIHGFIETYDDPLGLKGSYEGIVELEDPAGGRRLWAWSCWSFRGRASASCSSSA